MSPQGQKPWTPAHPAVTLRRMKDFLSVEWRHHCRCFRHCRLLCRERTSVIGGVPHWWGWGLWNAPLPSWKKRLRGWLSTEVLLANKEKGNLWNWKKGRNEKCRKWKTYILGDLKNDTSFELEALGTATAIIKLNVGIFHKFLVSIVKHVKFGWVVQTLVRISIKQV